MQTSCHHHHRCRAVCERLGLVLAGLDRLSDRRRPLSPRFAGPARRTISEARALFGLPPRPLPRILHPAQLLVETLSVLEASAARNAPVAGPLRAISHKTHPRDRARA